MYDVGNYPYHPHPRTRIEIAPASDIDLIKICLERGIKPKIKLKHKGYKGKWDYSVADNILWGRVKNIKGLISFESVDGSVDSLIEEFKLSVDEYIEDCEEMKLKPIKT